MSEAAAPRKRALIVKDRFWPVLGYTPHKGQRPIHKSRARHRVASLGRRTGKSTMGGHELTLEAITTRTMLNRLEASGQRREFWIVGPEYTDSEKEFRVLWNDCARLEMPLDRPGSYNNPESGEMVISLWGGRFICRAKSAKYPQTLVGEGLSGVVLAEAAKLKPLVWSKYLRPTLADFRGWSLWLSTPEGKNFFYEAWKRGQDPKFPAWESWRMPSWVNSIVFPGGCNEMDLHILRAAVRDNTFTPKLLSELSIDDEIIEMFMEMTEERFNQEVGADFSEYVGRVFKSFDEEIHVRDLKYNPDLPLYGCCDYGWTNPFVWLAIQVDIWDNVYVLGEYRAINRDINDIADDLTAWPLASMSTSFYPDPAGPGDSAVLEKKLHSKANTDTGGELKWRLEQIRKWLKREPAHLADDHPEKQPKLMIDRSCTGLIYEMNEYRYPETKAESRAEKEAPMDKDDHAPEALGRFFRGYYGPPQGAATTGGRARVRKANVG